MRIVAFVVGFVAFAATLGNAASGLQICNGTPLPVHVAFIIVSPMDFENNLQPGECMTRNNIPSWWRDIEIRLALKDNEFKSSDNVVPWLKYTGGPLLIVCGVGLAVASAGALPAVTAVTVAAGAAAAETTTAVAVGTLATSLGFSSSAVAGLNVFCATGCAIGGGMITATEFVDNLQTVAKALWSNCKSWTIRGGPRASWTPDGKELFANPLSAESKKYELTDEHYYDCLTPNKLFKVEYPDVPGGNTHGMRSTQQ